MTMRKIPLNQKDAIVQYLTVHPGLSEKEAAEKLGVKNLRARVDELRKRGIPIVTRRVRGGVTTYHMNAPIAPMPGISAAPGTQSPAMSTVAPQGQTGAAAGVNPPNLTSNLTADQIKDQFVAAIQQVFLEKGLIGSPPTTAPGMPSMAQPLPRQTAARLQETEDTNAEDADFLMGKLRTATNQIDAQVRKQVEALDRINTVLGKTVENIKRQGEVYREQDMRRTSGLMRSVDGIQSALSAIQNGKVLSGVGRGKQNSRERDLTQSMNLTVSNAKITVKGIASISGITAPRPRMSGIDPNDEPKTKETERSSGTSNGGLLRGLLVGALGLAGVGALLSATDSKNEIIESVGDILRGGVAKATEYVVETMAPAMAEAVAKAVRENPVLSLFTTAGLARGAQALAKTVEKTASSKVGSFLPGAAKIAGGAKTAGLLASKAANRIPLIGGGLEFGMRMYRGESVGRAALGAGGGMAGAAAGAAAGLSFGPGAVVASPLLAIAGGWAGSKAADGIADYANKDSQTQTAGGVESVLNFPSANLSSGTDSDHDKYLRRNPLAMERYIFNYFREQGYSPEAAAGITGNLKHETGGFKSLLNPDDKTKSGKSVGRASGLAQWNGARLKEFRNKYGVDPHQASIDTQLQFISHELRTGYKGADAGLKNSRTAAEAAMVFEKQYEKPAEGSTLSRRNNANDILRRLGGSTANVRSPKDTAMIPRTAEPLRGVMDVADNASSPTVIVAPSNTSITQAPSKTMTDTGSQVLTVRNNTSSWIRNSDKHTGHTFSRP